MPGICHLEGCGRPARALGLCQTHYKHLKKFGRPRPIHLKREGRSGTVKFAGLSLTAECADLIDLLAEQRGVSRNAVITDVLEEWARRHNRAKRKPPPTDDD